MAGESESGSADAASAGADGRPGAQAPPSAGPATVEARVRSLLGELAAAPRPAGSAAEARARAGCARWLAELGYQVTELPFAYSALPGRWGTPLAGLISLLTLATVAVGGAAGRPWTALAGLAGAALVVAATGRWVARHGVLALPLMRRQSVNLVAMRGDRPPAVWLMAHLDSKSQPVPIGLRAVAVMGTMAVWTATAAMLLAAAAGVPIPAGAWATVAALGALCAVPIVASTVGARSDGALDNASGVAAVLAAAALLPADPELPIAVVITSAEELGLAGSRAWVAGMGPAIALNCDGVDDMGDIVIMYSGRAPGGVLDAFATAAVATPPRVRRLLPGILTDHVSLADAGWRTVTVSRGGAATLRRIHTRADSLSRLRGDGLMPVAKLLVAAATRLAGADGGPPPQVDHGGPDGSTGSAGVAG